MRVILLLAAMAAALGCDAARAQLSLSGRAAQTFSEVCSGCHGNTAVPGAPNVDTLRQLTPEAIYAALTSGSMRVQAQDESDELKRAIATYLAGRPPGLTQIAGAERMPNRCRSGAPLDASAASWNGWGIGNTNSRFQSGREAGLTAAQVPGLHLKWAFGFPGAAVVYTQPTVVGGRVFIGVDTGYIYSLDAASGCVYWSFAARSSVRGAFSAGSYRAANGSTGTAVYFGDLRGNLYALDAVSGEPLWQVVADAHASARITGSIKLYEHTLYVPIASGEEGVGGSLQYPCCSFRGSVAAFDAQTGRQLWKTAMIDAPLKPWRTNSAGTQLWGPSGASVWSSPALDPTHHRLYVDTGDAYTPPAMPTTDAVLALDMRTGRILWHVQDTPGDAWIAACWPPNISDNCPRPLGPDYDLSSAPILVTLPSGRRLVIAGQKSGTVWAHDPDAHGALKWKAPLAAQPVGDQGEIVWGGAADAAAVYYGLNRGAVAALNVADGQLRWLTSLPPAAAMAAHAGESGPVSEIPGVIFSGGWDGVERALSSSDGHVLWQFDTAQDFITVNAVKAHGGSLGAAGATIAGGLLLVPSGYVGVQNGMPGNVLLAFAP